MQLCVTRRPACGQDSAWLPSAGRARPWPAGMTLHRRPSADGVCAAPQGDRAAGHVTTGSPLGRDRRVPRPRSSLWVLTWPPAGQQHGVGPSFLRPQGPSAASSLTAPGSGVFPSEASGRGHSPLTPVDRGGAETVQDGWSQAGLGRTWKTAPWAVRRQDRAQLSGKGRGRDAGAPGGKVGGGASGQGDGATAPERSCQPKRSRGRCQRRERCVSSSRGRKA